MTKGKKIGWSIFAIVMVVILAFCGIWLYKNIDNIGAGLDGANLYTQEDLDQAYKDGYTEGNKDKEANESLINEYRETITELTDKVNKLEALNQEYLENNTNQATEITELKEEIEKLKKEIEHYKMLLSAYEDYNVSVIDYYVNGQLYDTDIVDTGDVIGNAPNFANNLPTQANSDVLWFNGWTLDESKVLDAECELVDEEYVVTEDVKLYANISYADVEFYILNDVAYETTFAYLTDCQYPNETAFIGNVPEGYEFKEWALLTTDGGIIKDVDLQNFNYSNTAIRYPSTSEALCTIKFVAVLDGYVTINYNVFGELYKAYDVKVATDIYTAEAINLILNADNTGFNIYNGETMLTSETVDYNGEVLSNYVIESSSDKPLKGWTLDKTGVNYITSNYPITNIGQEINFYYYENKVLTVAFHQNYQNENVAYAGDYEIIGFQAYTLWIYQNSNLNEQGVVDFIDIEDVVDKAKVTTEIYTDNVDVLDGVIKNDGIGLTSLRIYLENNQLKVVAEGVPSNTYTLMLWAYCV